MERSAPTLVRVESKLVKTAAKGGAVLIALSLAACSGSASPKTTELTPDLSGFLKPGTTDTCYNGGPRPCAVVLRTSPAEGAEQINTAPHQNEVKWPLESYYSNPGDTVKVICYEPNGDKMLSFENGLESSDWYKIAVPMDKVINPTVQAQLQQTDSEVSTIKIDDHNYVVGWASVEWFDENTPDPSIPVCKQSAA